MGTPGSRRALAIVVALLAGPLALGAPPVAAIDHTWTDPTFAGGAYPTLVLYDNGIVQAWGFNGFGQLGNGSTTDTSFRRDVPGVSDVTAIAAGIFHSVAIDRSGKVSSWGWNYFGQLGDGSITDHHVPVPAVGLTGASLIPAGAFHSVVPRISR